MLRCSKRHVTIWRRSWPAPAMGRGRSTRTCSRCCSTPPPRAGSRAEELAALRESLNHWRLEWRIVEKALAALQLQERLRSEEGRPVAGDEAAGGLRSLPRGAMQLLRQNSDRLRQLDKELDRVAA